MTDEYPEHEKMAKIRDKSQAIGEFLDWCDEKGWHLAEWDESRKVDDRMMPLMVSTIDLLAMYFDIDLAKIEEEKRQMLATLRAKS